jgi:BBSome-interacting protein 1
MSAVTGTSNGLVAQEVLPKSGLVFSEKSSMSEVMCKPKIMPIKSAALEKLEKMEREMRQAQQAAADQVSGSSF